MENPNRPVPDRRDSFVALRRGVSTSARRFSRSVAHSLAGFLGVEESEVQALRWENRRKRYAESIGKLKDEYRRGSETTDELDGQRSIRDPLRKPGYRRSVSDRGGPPGRSFRKSSVAHMTIKGIGNVVGLRTKGGGRIPRTSQGIDDQRSVAASQHWEEFSLVDDVFYDDQGAEVKPEGVPRTKRLDSDVDAQLQSSAPAPGWRRRPPQALPDTPGTDMVDQPDFGFGRIKAKVLHSALRRDKRVMGHNVVSRFFRQSIHGAALTKDVVQQLDEMDDHRPYFTYWATFVQVVIFIVAVSVYGIAPFGIGKNTEQKMVRLSNLAREVKSYTEPQNIFFGPRQLDLIHLGAKYSPCMRVDPRLVTALELDRKEENYSACCVRNDGSGCVQRVESHCGSLSSWKKWTVGARGPGGRTSGSVCGQDPSYCINPASVEPFAWTDSIVDWPLCIETRKPNATLGSRQDRHMSCEILGRPCCHGIQGECIITTREHCELIRGFFHNDKFLCAQTSCLEEICGMIPFSDSKRPDQFYRLWTSLFLHGGLLHLFVTILFQMWIMRDIEKLIGCIRMTIIYIGSGIAGNLASSTFLPYQVEAGPSGSQFGVLACLLVEVLQSYQMYRRPHRAILRLIVPIILLFVFGLLPWFDNWAHLFGFVFGFLLAFALMPYVSFGKFDRRRKLISIVICLGSAVTLFISLLLIFYFVPSVHCVSCHYFNCIPITEEFCENMRVNLKKISTYSDML